VTKRPHRCVCAGLLPPPARTLLSGRAPAASEAGSVVYATAPGGARATGQQQLAVPVSNDPCALGGASAPCSRFARRRATVGRRRQTSRRGRRSCPPTTARSRGRRLHRRASADSPPGQNPRPDAEAHASPCRRAPLTGTIPGTGSVSSSPRPAHANPTRSGSSSLQPRPLPGSPKARTPARLVTPYSPGFCPPVKVDIREVLKCLTWGLEMK